MSLKLPTADREMLSGQHGPAASAGTARRPLSAPLLTLFFALASIVADEIYGHPVPLIVLSPTDFARLQTGQLVTVEENSRIEIQ